MFVELNYNNNSYTSRNSEKIVELYISVLLIISLRKVSSPFLRSSKSLSLLPMKKVRYDFLGREGIKSKYSFSCL